VAIVAGIDEAGFGPVLGPLVVTAVVWEVPEPLVGGDLWSALAPTVIATPRKRHSGLVIGDSKKVYTPAAGLTHLERGVLGALSLASPRLGSLRALLGWLCPPAPQQMDAYPWYRRADINLPVAVDATDLRLRARGLASAAGAAGVQLTAAQCRLLPVGQYNRLIEATRNKATTLLDQTCSLIDWVWGGRRAGERVSIFVDRQGGRTHYLPILQRMFVGGRWKVLAEQPDHSGYRATLGGDVLEIHFLKGAEAQHLPVALASMTSKYLRELFMRLLNRYWAEQLGGRPLKPTAGYYTDGKRFLDDIADTRRRLNTPDHLLIRSR